MYGSLIALIKTDLKKLAAFSTLAHVSFVVLGIFTFTVLGLDGGIFQILNESLIGAALFVLLGLLYERYGTYEIRDYGGLATRHPWMVTMFVITTLAAVGLPMLNGFVGEFLILSGTMQSVFAHHIALDGRRHHRRHLRRGLHALDDPARLLRPPSDIRPKGGQQAGT